METQLVRPQLSSSGPSIIPTMLHRSEATQVVIIVKMSLNQTCQDVSTRFSLERCVKDGIVVIL